MACKLLGGGLKKCVATFNNVGCLSFFAFANHNSCIFVVIVVVVVEDDDDVVVVVLKTLPNFHC